MSITPSQNSSRVNFTILSVDDDSFIRTIMSAILKKHGYTVLTADSGEMALKLLETTTPDLILTDVEMPNMNGYDLCLKIKENEATQHLPVFFVSSHSDEEHQLKTMSVGAIGYLPKPINAAVLSERLRLHFQNSEPKYSTVNA